ncbi:hypothetical protein FJ959_22255 [Mesorhizobium sp. B2-2-4]|uniref:hypothetical protein n=1 Tax=unclassified Mesorhizobium TaxID=325217 RepID=UPI00112770DC|nr:MULTISPECIES: hypothetical protein [unclassified Mesorhizobium]TPM53255.1 hypothetical protein FJ959_22255 [Mesorhizobium sp. B2-2-4]TPM62102.1 hypothetical protein FJ965_21115 [Mesorhizobium sp. B2-2-1]TPN68473.1 hypothetical protein FJ984_11595 [Mesorhizobium sp. B1-1-3]
MLVLGLDIATSCGHGLIEPHKKPDTWRCGAWHSAGENGEDKAGVLALSMIPYLKANRPVFAAIEMPQRNVKTFGRKREDMAGQSVEQTINPNALQLSALAGGAVAILDAFHIPWGLVASATWRSVYFGKGVKPVGRDDWKDLAIKHAQMQKIPLPSTKAAQRDAAEAIGVAAAWERCTFIPARHQASFMALRTGQARAA